MQALYTDESYNSVHQQLSRRLILLGVILAVLLGVFIYAMIIRTEWLAMVALSLAGCFAVFYSDLFCAPLLRYGRLVRSALSGRSHEKELEFVRVDPDPSVVDGVTRRCITFLGDPDKHGSREMTLYWDAELPLPQWTQGETVNILYNGRSIIGFQPAAPSSRP